ncbi:9820_t:CDS:2 [Paraglomus brasilianum]|uniref:9820_t:CDS:1 n=1 Tax=Paraglomus brasilianum TaxID=144538 RepID=A0A9N9E873_9GLOM|nr:9820_t:CDS:2 [Paraglomus brasilianum]
MNNYSYLFDDFDKNLDFSEELKKRFNLDDKEFEKIRKNRDSHELIKLVKKMDPDFYKDSPFISIAEDLLKALKESLIEKLVIATSHSKGRYTENGDPRKIEKFQKTFGLFPNCKLECIELKVIKKTKDRLPNMTYLLPNYKTNEQVKERKLIEALVSNLKDEDFTKAAEEYKEKTKTSNNK